MKHDGHSAKHIHLRILNKVGTHIGYRAFFLGYHSHVAINDDLNVYGLKECNRGHPRIWCLAHRNHRMKSLGLGFLVLSTPSPECLGR